MDYIALITEYALDRLGEIIVTDTDWKILYRNNSLPIEDYQWDKWCIPYKDDLGEDADIEWDISDKETGHYYRARSFEVLCDYKMYLVHHIVDVSDYVGLFQDLSAYSKHWKAESEIDKLSGLYNKGKFNSLYKNEFPNYDSIAIFNMDVNYLKRTNDTYGHEAGNKLLIKASDSIKSVLNEDSYGFRLGGDEFMIVVRDIDETEAERIHERWEKELDRLNAEDPDIECIVACGIVVAHAPYDMRTILRQADDLMYANKRNIKLSRGDDPDSR